MPGELCYACNREGQNQRAGPASHQAAAARHIGARAGEPIHGHLLGSDSLLAPRFSHLGAGRRHGDAWIDRRRLGLSDMFATRPLQAALSSAATFTIGAALPMLTVMRSSQATIGAVVSGSSLICLAALGAVAAQTGGAPA